MISHQVRIQKPFACAPLGSRSFINRLESFVRREVVEPVMDKLHRSSWVRLADERLVTESRRKLPRQPPAVEMDLAGRIGWQRRGLVQRIPTRIRIHKDKEVVTFVWPKAEGSEPQQGVKCSSEGTTTALAEYLRAFTPSTDGVFGTDRVVYGRRGVKINDMMPVGGYAVRIRFSDGHDAGIYPYDYLYHLTSREHKFRLMRDYIRTLRKQKKSRNPPRRAPSSKRLEKVLS